MSEEDDLAAFVNYLEQAKVAIDETLAAVEKEHPDLEVGGFAFEARTFFFPGPEGPGWSRTSREWCGPASPIPATGTRAAPTPVAPESAEPTVPSRLRPSGGPVPEEDLAAFVNYLEQAKVAIDETLAAVEQEHPDLEVCGFAFEARTFFFPGLKAGMVRNLPGMVRPGLAEGGYNTGCSNTGCS